MVEPVTTGSTIHLNALIPFLLDMTLQTTLFIDM